MLSVNNMTTSGTIADGWAPKVLLITAYCCSGDFMAKHNRDFVDDPRRKVPSRSGTQMTPDNFEPER